MCVLCLDGKKIVKDDSTENDGKQSKTIGIGHPYTHKYQPAAADHTDPFSDLVTVGCAVAKNYSVNI